MTHKFVATQNAIHTSAVALIRSSEDVSELSRRSPLPRCKRARFTPGQQKATCDLSRLLRLNIYDIFILNCFIRSYQDDKNHYGARGTCWLHVLHVYFYFRRYRAERGVTSEATWARGAPRLYDNGPCKWQFGRNFVHLGFPGAQPQVET